VATKLDSPIYQTGPFDFFNFGTKEAFEDYYARDSSGTSLASSMPQTQLEEEDPVDEGAKDKGRSG
jgi:hypothetical protein